jgi:hypothetical protein
MDTIYCKFGMEFKVGLSTRNPDKFIGDLAIWDKAEAQLKAVLDNVAPGKWKLNEGDGAFYGPKIDISLTDALKREFQCATIQVSFDLVSRLSDTFHIAYPVFPLSITRVARLQPARAIQPDLQRSRAILRCQPHSTGHDPPSARRIHREVHRSLDGTLRGQLAVLVEP